MSLSLEIFNQFGENSGYIKGLYDQFLKDPLSVGKDWGTFFFSLAEISAAGGRSSVNPNLNQSSERLNSLTRSRLGNPDLASEDSLSRYDERLDSVPDLPGVADYRSSPALGYLQSKVERLISAYRNYGHLRAKINPLSRDSIPVPVIGDLDIERYGFTSQDQLKEVLVSGFAAKDRLQLAELLRILPKIYCGTIGFEYMHVVTDAEREWFLERVERLGASVAEGGVEKMSDTQPFPPGISQIRDSDRLSILNQLLSAEAFESELHRKYVGQKRFSLQGGETLIPMIQVLVSNCAAENGREVVIGMAHRGRLNVLTHICGQSLVDLFTQFEDSSSYSVLGNGDVKYHHGLESDRVLDNGKKIKVTLAPNPSHLEFVNPVVVGMARAKQDLFYGGERKPVLPVLIHGDAACAGQGVVFETFQLANVPGYTAGGTVHIVINNQVGFTTTPDESRSSIYCSDVAKAVGAPIFHVNGEDPEACAWVTSLALEYRQEFGRDVVIDLVCYRKYGHNEGDDPSFTQPQLYSEIAAKESIGAVYANQLMSKGLIEKSYVSEFLKKYHQDFSRAQETPRGDQLGDACSLLGRLRVHGIKTGVDGARLQRIAGTLVSFPSSFTPHPKLRKIIEKRVETVKEGGSIEWGVAEALAYGSLVLDGVDIRLSGQDSCRGTFSHRHLVLDDYNSGGTFSPLAEMQNKFPEVGSEKIGRFEVFNSPLSETGVLGLEYGYSCVNSKGLTLWEAQFGDFANGAQVIIDQFIASSEAKWGKMCGLVLLLPHGYEGQGPEHSSARLERYLQLCGEGNLHVCYPSNALQYFHLLRLQGLSEIKRPLIVMTPKSLLRLPEACSEFSLFTKGQFEPVIDTFVGDGAAPEYTILCTGKVYYDLHAALIKGCQKRVRLIRIEQLYPFPQFELKRVLKEFPTKDVIWAQEEPQNMGAWSYIEPYLRFKMNVEPHYYGRDASASTAAGSAKRHASEQNKFLQEIIEATNGAPLHNFHGGRH